MKIWMYHWINVLMYLNDLLKTSQYLAILSLQMMQKLLF
jgi:hypothetical protein